MRAAWEKLRPLFYKREFGKDYLRVWVEFARFIVVLVVVIALVVLLIIVPTDRRSCRETAERMGMEWDHNMWSGCMVEVGEILVPIDSIRINDDGQVVDR